MIRGLSLTRPWPWAFIHPPVPKRAENRSWMRRGLAGSYLALHAAKSWNEDDRAWIADTCGMPVPPKDEHQHSVIFAVCRVSAVVFVKEPDEPPTLIEMQSARVPGDQGQWIFGPYAWLLDGFVALAEPVPCRGAQGLWNLPDDVLAAARQQWSAA